MTDDICPRVGCGMPYSHLIKTDEPFKHSPMSMTCAQMCYVPIFVDGSPGVAMVYHTYDDLAEDEGEDPSEPADLSEDHDVIFELVRAVCEGEIETGSAGTGSVLHGNLRRLAVEHGVEKDRVKPVVLNLIHHGFIDEIEDAVFKVPDGVVA